MIVSNENDVYPRDLNPGDAAIRKLRNGIVVGFEYQPLSSMQGEGELPRTIPFEGVGSPSR